MTHIRYIDGKNLYGSQIMFDLPTDDYRFEDKIVIKRIENNKQKN